MKPTKYKKLTMEGAAKVKYLRQCKEDTNLTVGSLLDALVANTDIRNEAVGEALIAMRNPDRVLGQVRYVAVEDNSVVLYGMKPNAPRESRASFDVTSFTVELGDIASAYPEAEAWPVYVVVNGMKHPATSVTRSTLPLNEDDEGYDFIEILS